MTCDVIKLLQNITKLRCDKTKMRDLKLVSAGSIDVRHVLKAMCEHFLNRPVTVLNII